MGLDIRWPIGLMFSLIGAIMVVYGLITGSGAEIYQRSLGINVNLCWGSLLVIFGGISATYFAEELIRYDAVDVVVQGYDTLEVVARLMRAVTREQRDFSTRVRPSPFCRYAG